MKINKTKTIAPPTYQYICPINPSPFLFVKLHMLLHNLSNLQRRHPYTEPLYLRDTCIFMAFLPRAHSFVRSVCVSHARLVSNTSVLISNCSFEWLWLLVTASLVLLPLPVNSQKRLQSISPTCSLNHLYGWQLSVHKRRPFAECICMIMI